jgi:hypothetical protein
VLIPLRAKRTILCAQEVARVLCVGQRALYRENALKAQCHWGTFASTQPAKNAHFKCKWHSQDLRSAHPVRIHRKRCISCNSVCFKKTEFLDTIAIFERVQTKTGCVD